MTTKTKPATKKAPAKSSKAKKPAAKKPAKAASKNGDAKPKKLSALDAAAKVLAESKEPLNTREMIEAMAAKKLWTSPGGATPHATLYSAILREINAKAKDARFKKTERGQFAFNG
jgi:ethanolamine utilization cobalamin adenosyltransferase